MKIALVHDYIKEYGGAERVLEALHELYPNAPVFTSVYLPEFLGPHKDRFTGWDIRTSWAQKLPFKEKLISPLRLVSPFLFGSFDLKTYDVVIVSATGAYMSNAMNLKSQSANRKTTAQNSKQVHITYCHTPPRYLYGFATARNWKKNVLLRLLGESANMVLRFFDQQAAKNVDYFITNSVNVQKRIEKFYHRESMVIYPPVEVDATVDRKRSSRDYYLAGGRLARPKHIDLIVKMAVKNKLPLKVFGRPFGDFDLDSLKTDGSTIEFLGEVSDAEKYTLMAGAKAFIFSAEDEDFGITPVEAMAVGTPVIAYRSGGVVESLVEGKTGLFFDALTQESLYETVKKLDTIKIDPKECVEQGRKFNKERFKTQIQLFVNNVYSPQQ